MKIYPLTKEQIQSRISSALAGQSLANVSLVLLTSLADVAHMALPHPQLVDFFRESLRSVLLVLDTAAADNSAKASGDVPVEIPPKAAESELVPESNIIVG